MNEITDREIEDRNAVLNSLQKAYEDCVKRIDNLVKLKISPQNTDGTLLSDEEFISQKGSLMAEKRNLQEKLGDTDNRVNKWLELSAQTFEFACYARYWFENGDIQTKRDIFNRVGTNIILKDEIVRIELKEPLEYIEKAKKEMEEISSSYEPNKKGYTEAQILALYSKNPSLLPRLDSN